MCWRRSRPSFRPYIRPLTCRCFRTCSCCSRVVPTRDVIERVLRSVCQTRLEQSFSFHLQGCLLNLAGCVDTHSVEVRTGGRHRTFCSTTSTNFSPDTEKTFKREGGRIIHQEFRQCKINPPATHRYYHTKRHKTLQLKQRTPFTVPSARLTQRFDAVVAVFINMRKVTVDVISTPSGAFRGFQRNHPGQCGIRLAKRCPRHFT